MAPWWQNSFKNLLWRQITPLMLTVLRRRIEWEPPLVSMWRRSVLSYVQYCWQTLILCPLLPLQLLFLTWRICSYDFIRLCAGESEKFVASVTFVRRIVFGHLMKRMNFLVRVLPVCYPVPCYATQCAVLQIRMEPDPNREIFPSAKLPSYISDPTYYRELFRFI